MHETKPAHKSIIFFLFSWNNDRLRFKEKIRKLRCLIEFKKSSEIACKIKWKNTFFYIFQRNSRKVCACNKIIQNNIFFLLTIKTLRRFIIKWKNWINLIRN